MKSSNLRSGIILLSAFCATSIPAFAHFDEDDIRYFQIPTVVAEPTNKQATQLLAPQNQSVSDVLQGVQVHYFNHPMKPQPFGLLARAKSLQDATQSDARVTGLLTQKLAPELLPRGTGAELKVRGNILQRIVSKSSKGTLGQTLEVQSTYPTASPTQR